MNNAGWSLTPRQAGADTYTGRPFGNGDFVSEMAERFGRCWTRGGSKKKQALARPAQQQTDQFTLL